MLLAAGCHRHVWPYTTAPPPLSAAPMRCRNRPAPPPPPVPEWKEKNLQNVGFKKCWSQNYCNILQNFVQK
jgi:hypothetical protein